ncbi:MAG TPA: dTDP-4-dehydrorhamnose reductase [Burkholderiales bacterium]|nr:dTDP-4-dehydrorhamnose reductase [Burkholderiales bacterium]
MKILLTGRNGQVGWELERVLPLLGEVIATDRSKLDLAMPDAIRRVVRETKPDLIINAAAYTAVDRAEAEGELARQINGVAPGILAEEAKRLGALMVHFSTDYVFDGTKGAPYVESDAPNPLNVYGKTKLEGERRLAAAGCRHLLLRTSWVYAPRGKNFFVTIAKKALAGEPLRVVSDQHGVPTDARFLAENTIALLQRGEEGTFHVVPYAMTTWHGFASAIVSRLDSRSTVQAIRSDEYPTPARRPRYSVLDHAKLSKSVGTPPPWDSLLDRCVRAWTSA